MSVTQAPQAPSSHAPEVVSDQATRTQELRRRLLGHAASPEGRRDRLLGWLVPGVIALLGGILRFLHLGRPHALVMDETYYVKDGWSLIRFGVELTTRLENPEADKLWITGDTDVYSDTGSYVVHPPVGKWLIGAGEWLLGPQSAYGWRLAVAVLGTVSILVVGRVAHRLFGSTLLAGIAAFLVAFEGLHFVMSRTAFLDIIVMFFALCGFAALLVDRHASREVLAAKVGALPVGQWPATGPWLGWRPWRWVAGLSLALATSTKWSGLFFVAVFGLMTLLWDIGARRAAGVRHWTLGAVLKDGPYAAVQLVLTTAVVYPLSWIGWFVSDQGYLRTWAAEHPGEGVQWLPAALRSWVYYHQQMWNFSTTLSSPHSYQSNPWGWLVMARPTSLYYQGSKLGEGGCTVDSCSAAVNAIGTLPLWWAALPALAICLFHWVVRRDWRAGAILAGIAAGYLPWFMWQHRTIFTFYTIVFQPYVVLAVTFAIGLYLRGALGGGATWRTRRIRVWVVAGYLVLCLLVFAYFLPVYTAQVIPYPSWFARMWFPSWI